MKDTRQHIQHLLFLTSWISSTRELPLISGLKKFKLEIEEAQSWLESSIHYDLLKNKNKEIIGLATLSNNEADLPDRYAEICHCIVHPDYRRIYHGSSIIIKMMQKAKLLGFECVVGRVLKTNLAGQKLLENLNWTLSKTNYSQDNSVIWYSKNIVS